MEPEVHLILLWLYRENPWLYIIEGNYFWKGEGKFQFFGKNSPNSIN